MALDFDDKAAARVEAIYATPDVAATRIAVLRVLEPAPGERILDLGCGPGYVALELARAVGGDGQVLGLDLSEPMLAIAARRCAGLEQIELRAGDVARLPVADGSFDAAVAMQTFAYVRDLDAALAELARALRAGGRAVVFDTDFAGTVWQSRERERMARVLAAYDAHCPWPDLPRVLPGKARATGFAVTRVELVPILNRVCHANSFSHGLSRFIHTFVTGQGLISKDEADAWLAELTALAAAGEYLFSINRYLFLLTRR